MIIAVNLLEAAGLALLLTSLLRCYALHRGPSWRWWAFPTTMAIYCRALAACRRFFISTAWALDRAGVHRYRLCS